MSQVEFNYKGIITTLLCSEKDKMEEICKNFAIKSSIDFKKLCFLYLGNQIDLQLTFEETINKEDKEKKSISILVKDINSIGINKNRSIIKSKFPICPECKENIKFDVDDDKKINLECKNGHSIKLLIKEYENSQKIDISKIKCNECTNTKFNASNNEMYICNNCDIKLCPLCINKHNRNHNIINYELKDSICRKHNKIYISYCNKCKLNMCFNCQKEHESHDILLFLDIISNKDELLNNLNDFRKVMNIFDKDIEDIINKLKYVKKNVKMLYNMYYNMINNYEEKYRNYEILASLYSINNNKIIRYIKEIISMNNIHNKFENIINIYKKTEFHDEITMIYNINNNEKIKILGKQFVENNKNNCKILYKNKEYELTEEFDTKNINKDKLEIKLKGINNVTSIKYLFYECKSLELLPDIHKWNMENVTNMSFLFYECTSLKYLPDLSKWKTDNVSEMRCMFTRCSSLKSLSDISKWDTSKVTSISHIFSGCCLLESLPDISKWKTDNLINISYLFFNCYYLKYIPDLSKWKTDNVSEIQYMFTRCSSLKSLPDISKWKTDNVSNMENIFSSCSSLKSLPDISKWKTDNVREMKCMFARCSSLKSLPDISKWNTSKVIDISHIFYGCSSLTSIPDISKWNISNVILMSNIFDECESVATLPDISKWNTNKVISKEDAYNIQYQNLITEIEIGNLNTKVQIGEFIFELAEILYGDYAPKITGMMLEWDIEYLKHLIIFEPLKLKQIITDGFELLKSHNL